MARGPERLAGAQAGMKGFFCDLFAHRARIGRIMGDIADIGRRMASGGPLRGEPRAGWWQTNRRRHRGVQGDKARAVERDTHGFSLPRARRSHGQAEPGLSTG